MLYDTVVHTETSYDTARVHSDNSLMLRAQPWVPVDRGKVELESTLPPELAGCRRRRAHSCVVRRVARTACALRAQCARITFFKIRALN